MSASQPNREESSRQSSTFLPKMSNIKILRRIADMTGGGARVAIKVLYHVALVAEKQSNLLQKTT